MGSDFAAIILTHARADRVRTYNTLRRRGYTGRIILLIDEEDNQRDEYLARYPGEVEQFSKAEWAERVDVGDNFSGRGVVVYARNAVWEVARRIGLKWFVVLDDDYTYFSHRFARDATYKQILSKRLDDVFAAFVDYLRATPFVTVCMAQGGDYIAGGAGVLAIKGKRKAMNVFFCATERVFPFCGRLNEDVTAYTSEQIRGAAMITHNGFSVCQCATQSNKGGLTEAYLEVGTYVKSFYSIMYAPSCVRISVLSGHKNGVSHRRIHHRVNWNMAAPKIVPEIYRKEAGAGVKTMEVPDA